MNELGRRTEKFKFYDMNCGRLMVLNPRVHEESRKMHPDRKSTRLNSSHSAKSRMPSSA